MSVNWIKWCKGLSQKREVAVLASRLKRDRKYIASSLMEFWEWCDDNLDDVDFEGEDAIVSLGDRDSAIAIIDQQTGIEGMAEALCDPGVDWLDLGDGSHVRFKRFKRNNGSTAKARASDNRKKAIQRSSTNHVPHRTGRIPGPEQNRAEQSREEGCFLENVSVLSMGKGVQGERVLDQAAQGPAAPENSNGETKPGKSGAHAPTGNPDLPPQKRPDEGRETEPIPFGYSDRVWEIWSILEVSARPDQHGFLAKLAWADSLGFPWPRPLLDFVGRAKRARSPAAQLHHVLKIELGDRWEDFSDLAPTHTHCLWALDEVELGRRKEGA